MKTNLKAFELIEKGLSALTVSKLNENEVNFLHKKLMGEAQISTTQTLDLTADEVKKGYKVPDTMMAGKKNVVVTPNPKSPGGVRIEPTTEEMKEDQDVDIDTMAPTSDQQRRQTGPGEYGNNPKVDKQMDFDDADGMGIFEADKTKKNPWAICTAQLGKEFGTKERHLWSAKEKNKYERCVKDVKKSLKEGKNPISLFLENEITKIVERNLQPQITKRDLMKYLNEAEPTVAPPKPKKPVTKPDTRPRPQRPGQNPHPGEKEAPRAKSPKVNPEQAKDTIIKNIMKMLKK